MTRDEIISLAEKAGMPKWLQEDWFANPFDSFALKFAYLIAAAEREACAKVCENYPDPIYVWTDVKAKFADAIRARGQG
jgi:hypothetical protein